MLRVNEDALRKAWRRKVEPEGRLIKNIGHLYFGHQSPTSLAQATYTYHLLWANINSEPVAFLRSFGVQIRKANRTSPVATGYIPYLFIGRKHPSVDRVQPKHSFLLITKVVAREFLYRLCLFHVLNLLKCLQTNPSQKLPMRQAATVAISASLWRSLPLCLSMKSRTAAALFADEEVIFLFVRIMRSCFLYCANPNH